MKGMGVEIIAQRGRDYFLVKHDEETSRVFNREQHTLEQPFRTTSILARGYWDKPTLDGPTMASVQKEIVALL